MSRPTKALINLDALRSNYRLAQALAPNSQTMPMVKANAYGHGMVPVATALADLAPAFGVACIEEALELRKAGITQPILLLEGTFSAEEVAIAALENIWMMVENHAQKEAIINTELPMSVYVWLGLDSGMHRLGFQPSDIADVYGQLLNSRNVHKPIVLASHFACAEDLQNSYTQQQLDSFNQALASLSDYGDAQPLQSLANSASILARPDTHRDWNRPGYMLYGSSPFDHPHSNADKLQAVMTLTSAVISLRHIAAGEVVGYSGRWRADKPSTIATIAIGYGDGYPRGAPNGTPVLVNGVECPLVGNVSMDMITVDVSALTRVAIGDPVELWGPNLAVSRVAKLCNTIGYELMTRMPARVPRIYQ
jgi:alanine racemase